VEQADKKTNNPQIVICPHCGARMFVPLVVVQSNVNDWPCVKCHRRFPPR